MRTRTRTDEEVIAVRAAPMRPSLMFCSTPHERLGSHDFQFLAWTEEQEMPHVSSPCRAIREAFVIPFTPFGVGF